LSREARACPTDPPESNRVSEADYVRCSILSIVKKGDFDAGYLCQRAEEFNDDALTVSSALSEASVLLDDQGEVNDIDAAILKMAVASEYWSWYEIIGVKCTEICFGFLFDSCCLTRAYPLVWHK
jgi:hypothetical protein